MKDLRLHAGMPIKPVYGPDDLAGRDVFHGRAGRHFEDEITACLSGFVLPATCVSTRGRVQILIAVVTE